MTRLAPKLRLSRLRPPFRRVAALDAGSRRLKLLLLESDFGSLLRYVPVIVGLRRIGRWLENRAADKPSADGGVHRQPTTI